MSPPELARCMHMDHEYPLQTAVTLCRTRYSVSSGTLSMGFGHYSLDVPCDFANFVDPLTFHWHVSTCDDVYLGLDHHASPLIHYLNFPWPSHPIYMVWSQDHRVKWVVSVALPLRTFLGFIHPVFGPPHVVWLPSFPFISLKFVKVT